MVCQVPQRIFGCLLLVAANSTLMSTKAIADNRPPLLGTPWQLQSWSDVSPLTTEPITLSFEQKNLTGSSGCNRYRTGYQVNKQSLTVNSAIATTRKACPEPIMSQETFYLVTLTRVERFEISEQGELKLTYRTKAGTGTMIFANADSATPVKSSGQKIWLDAQNLTNWNQAGTPIPQAPQAQANVKQCQDKTRLPSLPEDFGLTRNGWSLVGPAQIYSRTTLLMAASNFDGMCRPLQYQAFIFVGGLFAGTLSPELMDSRSDGSAQPMFLYDAANFSVEFNRYTEKDALCCPSGVSRVSYRIDRTGDLPVVVPVEISTQAVATPNQ